jgi:hypothetical protein
MPRIVPGIIADYIEASFPELARGSAPGTLDEGALQVLGVLLSLVDRLDDRALAAFSADDYRNLIVATEFIRTTTNRWLYPRTSGRGPHAVVAFQPLGNRHPVEVLHNVLRSAREEPAPLIANRLGFLADTELANSIATDISSSEAAIANGMYKNACVMSGAALEALLLWTIQHASAEDRDQAYGRAQTRRTQTGRASLARPDRDPLRWTLEQYIEIARALPSIADQAADAALLAKDFRNLIHPGRAARLGTTATRASAAQGLAALLLVSEDLERRFASRG